MTTSGTLLRAALVFSVLLAGARAMPVAAQTGVAGGERSLVLVKAEPCASSPYDAAAFLRLLELELAGLALRVAPLPAAEAEAQAAVEGAVAVVTIACGVAEGDLTLRVSDLATGKRLERELDARAVSPDARPRALALALATLLETSLSEHAAGEDGAALALAPAVEQALRARLVQRLTPPSEAGVAVPSPAS
jgi:hypothetical protein